MFKKCQCILLPTEEKITSPIYKVDNHLNIGYGVKVKYTHKNCSYQHLYIISPDEEIKEGDWYIHYNEKLNSYLLFKADVIFNEGNNPNIIDKREFVCNYGNKKVMALTDPSLGGYIEGNHPLYGEWIGIRLPEIPQSFIEQYITEYNKGSKIEDIMVEYENIGGGIYQDDFELKINSKDNTITIRRIKDSWNREEVIELLYFVDKESKIPHSEIDNIGLDKWINNNL